MNALRNGFKVLWSLIAPLDVMIEVLYQAVLASWPGSGTPTALPLVARSRGILRGEADTDAQFSTKLLAWLDRWRTAGSAEAIAREIRDYLAGHPRVRIVTRGGYWVDLSASGVLTRYQYPWDWDSTSNPERAGYWSDIWIIVYPDPYAAQPAWGAPTNPAWGQDVAFGHQCPGVTVRALLGLIGAWKSAHTHVRAVIWSKDPTAFDTTNPASFPNGNWGQWSTGFGLPSDRPATYRYWEDSNV